MTTRYASCSCGQLSAQVSGDPVRVSICHCLACQRRSGGPFAQQARYPRENVQVSGQSTSYFRAGDEGGGATFHFARSAAPRCITSRRTWRRSSRFRSAPLPIPAFRATVSVYEERMHGWVVPPPDAEHWP